MLTKEYDFGVYGRDEDTISLTAYKLYKDTDGGAYRTNYDNEFISLILSRQTDEAKIKWLIDLGNSQYPSFYDEYMTEDYSDYDCWHDQEELTQPGTPFKIAVWIKNLPEYQLITRGE